MDVDNRILANGTWSVTVFSPSGFRNRRIHPAQRRELLPVNDTGRFRLTRAFIAQLYSATSIARKTRDRDGVVAAT